MLVINLAILDIKPEFTGCVFIGLVAGILIGAFTEYDENEKNKIENFSLKYYFL